MQSIRRAQSRGHANFGWLDSHHSFSFGHYYDPKHMGFSALRVINDDTVAGGAGFDTHGHRDMNIISYVLEGTIVHKDSMGNRFKIPEGDIQVMSAGTGVSHSEYNASKTQRLKFLQIWIEPDRLGVKPSYQQKRIVQQGALTPLVSPDGRQGSLTLHQDATLYRLELAAHQKQDLQARSGYLHIISGNLNSDATQLEPGDALATTAPLTVTAGPQGVIALWFDLP